MSETTNYGLFVSNDDQMTFREWRLKLSGETDSNMTKIDAALGEIQGRLDNVVQADFEESNPESPAYIQNRTHWKEVEPFAVLFEKADLTSSSYFFSKPIGLEHENRYDVTYIGEVSGDYFYDTTPVPYVSDVDSSVTGLILVLDDGEYRTQKTTGLPFAFVEYDAATAAIKGHYGFVISMDGSAKASIIVGGQHTTWHKLDPRYIPDDLGYVKTINGIYPDKNGNVIFDLDRGEPGEDGGVSGAMQVDFAENDSTAAGYIHNRTHWKEIVGVDGEVIPKTSLPFFGGSSYTSSNKSYTLLAGERYVVTWNAQTYACVGQQLNDAVCLGNLKFADASAEESDYPFCIKNINGKCTYYDGLTSGTRSAIVKVDGDPQITWHKLDRNYLPDDIGSGGVFIVTIQTVIPEGTTEGYLHTDSTISDVEQAFAEGKMVFAQVETYLLPLTSWIPGSEAVFSGMFSADGGNDVINLSICLDSSGELMPSASVLPTAEYTDSTYVRVDAYQDLTDKQKVQARTNIGVVGKAGSGESSTVFNNYDLNIASGGYSHAEGSGTESSNLTSHAEGFATRASGMASHSEGSGTEASGMAAHSEGTGSIASGGSAHAEGSNTKAYGMFSHTEGNATEAVNDNSHAQGLSTKATGRSTDVIGEFNAYESIIKDDLYSGFMETDEDKSGYTVYAFSSSDFVLSEDESSIIIMNYTEKDMLYLSPGDYYVADLDDVYTEINECVSNNSIDGSTTGGYTKYNVGYVKYTVSSKSKNRGSFAHIVGNGMSENERSNAHTLDWEGNAWFAGDVYVKSMSGKNRDNGSLRLVTTEDLAEVASASGSVVWGSF